MRKNFITGPSTRMSIVDGIRGNERMAWKCFVDTYAPLILAFCRRQKLQRSDAEDVVQEACIQVAKGIKSFDQELGRFRGWLGTIVERAIIRMQRKRLRAGLGQGGDSNMLDDLLLSSDGNEWNDEFDSYVFRVALARVQKSTSDLKWNAFQAVWLDDESVEDVTARLKVKSSWLYDNKFQLLRRLQKEVRRLTDDYAPFHRPNRPGLRSDSSCA